jgi:Transcription factor WhiB
MTAVAGLPPRGGEAGRSPLAVDDKTGAPDPAWSDDAACRGVGAEEFFGATARGERWCRRCPVVEVCFWSAMVAESDAGYRFGVWGGATPAVRARVAAVTGVGWARDRLVEAQREWAQRASGQETQRRAG